LSFICRAPLTDEENSDDNLDIGHGVELGKEDMFCYLGDAPDAGGGSISAVMARFRAA